MKKYIVEVRNENFYSVPVEAGNEDEARNLVLGFDTETLEDYRTDGVWDFEFGKEVTE